MAMFFSTLKNPDSSLKWSTNLCRTVKQWNFERVCLAFIWLGMLQAKWKQPTQERRSDYEVPERQCSLRLNLPEPLLGRCLEMGWTHSENRTVFPLWRLFHQNKNIKYIIKEIIKATQTLWIWHTSWKLITPTFISGGQLLLYVCLYWQSYT